MTRNIFHSYPRTNLFEFYTSKTEVISTEFLKKSYYVSTPYSIVIRILKKFKKIVTKNSTIKKTNYEHLESSFKDKGYIRSSFLFWIDLYLPLFFYKRYYATIKSFKPDIIYTQLHTVQVMRLVRLLSRKFKIPVVTHTLDDWISTTYQLNILSTIPNRKTIALIHSLMSSFNYQFCISSKMIKYFSSIFPNVKFHLLVNCFLNNHSQIPDFQDNYTTLNTINSKSMFILTYSGGLTLGRFNSIVNFANEIEKINQKNPSSNYYIQVLSPLNQKIFYEKINTSPFLFFNKSFETNDSSFLKILNESNALLHVESFEKSFINYTKYSLSTKITDYLFLKKPIIYFGPTDVGVCDTLIRLNLDSIIIVENKSSISKQLNKIFFAKEFFSNQNEYFKFFSCDISNLDFYSKINS
jgi:hypothetical protein